MTNTVRAAMAALLAISMAAPLAAQDADISGQWTLSFNSPDVGPVSMNLLVEQDGAEFAGGGDVMGYGIELSDGVVAGAELSFLLHVDVDGQFYTLELDGETDGNEMKGIVNAEGMRAPFTGSKKTDGWGRNEMGPTPPASDETGIVCLI